MTNIERYLSGDVDYDALTDAERCAICAAMEGEWCMPFDQRYCGNFYEEFTAANKYMALNGYEWANWYEEYDPIDDYLNDGTAALRLVERFRIHVCPSDYDSRWIGNVWDGIALDSNYDGFINAEGPTPAAAIVHAVCELARAQWTYKGAKA